MNNLIQKAKSTKALQFIDKWTSNPLFFVFLALADLFCYYLGLDVLLMYIFGIFIIYMVLFKDELSPLTIIIIFIDTTVSKKNSPSSALENPSNYYFQSVNYIQIITIIVLCVLCFFYRTIDNFIKHKIKFDEYVLSILILAFAFTFNGIFSSYYTFNDTLYGLALTFFFLIFYFTIYPNLNLTEKNFNTIAKSISIFSLMLLIELFALFIFDSPIVNGEISKDAGGVSFGWGIWNTMGMLLCVSLPFVVYLAIKEKHFYLYIIQALVIAFGIVLTTSKQAYIALAVEFVIMIISAFILLKGKKKIIPAVITALGVIAVVIILLNFEAFSKFTDFFHAFDSRLYLYQDALNVFLSYPIIGGGFYGHAFDTGYNYFGVTNIIPAFCHNTFLQFMSTSGAIGLLAYLYHRYVTVKIYVKNHNLERSTIGLALIGFLTCSLLDTHLFNLFGTLVYCVLILLFIHPSIIRKKEEINE